MAYASIGHLNRYFENFGTLYYGDRDNNVGTMEIATADITADLEASFNRLNTMLDSIQRIPIVPVGTNVKTGSYNPFLIEWNCCDTIYEKLKARHIVETQGRLPEWMTYFGSRCNDIFNGIVNEKIPLDTDTTNRGIGYPITITKTGYAALFSNWDSGFYSRSDFPREYRVKIVGTTDGNGIGQAIFQVSEDGSFSFLTGTYTSGTQWLDLNHGLRVRFEHGSVTGSLSQLERLDEWKITCTPINVRNVGYSSSFKEFGRG